jgi:hypothetical protein
MTRASQDPDIGRRNIVEVFLVTDRREKFGLVENAKEFPDLADEVEETAKPFDLLSDRVRRTGPLADAVARTSACGGLLRLARILGAGTRVSN